MILDKNDLLLYLNEDKKALKKQDKKRPRLIGDDIWRFQIALRKHEYYHNVKKKTLITKLLKNYYGLKHYRIGIKLGFTIPINVCGEGLRLAHTGSIAINDKAKIGKNCTIHICVNIGASKGGVPKIGDNVYIAPGVKVFGDITISDGTTIGANSVVNKSFLEPNTTIVGAPACVVKKAGEDIHGK